MADLKRTCINGTCYDVPESYSKQEADALLDAKQNKLTAGTNITIEGDVISATGGGGDVSGVKGQQESSYRTGNVNLTPDNILFLGTNLTGGVSGDTSALWKGLGTGYAYVSETGQTYGQPSQYGIIHTTVRGNLVWQTWHGTNNQVYIRYANSGNVTNMPNWTPIDTDTTYTAGENIQIAQDGTISATDTVYTAGKSLDLNGTRFAVKWRNLNATIDAFSLANNTTVTKKFLDAPASGEAIVNITATFAANATGSRFLVLDDNGNPATTIRVPACPEGATVLHVCSAFPVTEGDPISAKFLQSSGGALQVSDIDLDGWLIEN